MSARREHRIEFEEAAFDPMRVMAVTHDFSDHPLLQLDKLVALGRRLAASNSVRWHSDTAKPDTSFHTAPDTHKGKWGAAQTLERIEEAQAWCSLLNVQQDPEYRTLVDELLDDVRGRVEPKDPGMCFRAGWIFVTSPGAITPFHIDHEHNFILQARGTKTLHVWEPLDPTVLPEEALELFHGEYSRDKVKWREELEAKAHKFELVPGMGGYMPTNAPHWVKNGPGVSVTVSATYYTNSTNRRKLLYRCNHLLRSRGLSPAAVGGSGVRDSVKLATFNVARVGKHLLNRARGRPVEDLRAAYAPVF